MLKHFRQLLEGWCALASTLATSHQPELATDGSLPTCRLRELLDAFVENGTAFKLDLSGGQVQLENLVLKPIILPGELPVALEAGVIGRVALEVPLLRLLSRPIRLRLEDVTLVLRTDQPSLDHAAVLGRVGHERVQAIVDALKAEEDAGRSAGLVERLFGVETGLVGRLLTRIVHNVEVQLCRVHVRCEHTPSPAAAAAAAASSGGQFTVRSSASESRTLGAASSGSGGSGARHAHYTHGQGHGQGHGHSHGHGHHHARGGWAAGLRIHGARMLTTDRRWQPQHG